MKDDMLHDWIEIDQQVLVAINSWHAEWADQLMWCISGKWTWLPLYVLLIGLLLWRYGWKRTLLMVLAIGMAVGLADFISSGIIKPFVCRLRPTHDPELMGILHLVNGYRGGMFGFVSSHAANTLACALVFIRIWTQKNDCLERKQSLDVRYAWLLLIWVVMNCYSRMYLGVHYPGDILGGLLVGGCVAELIYWLWQQVDNSCFRCARHEKDNGWFQRKVAVCEDRA